MTKELSRYSMQQESLDQGTDIILKDRDLGNLSGP